MWAASGAWFTFYSAQSASKKQSTANTENLIAGLEAELDLISAWASGGKNDSGYLQSKTQTELVKEHPDWFYPSRQIFSFDAPTLQRLTASTELRKLGDIAPALVTLNHSIHRLFNLNTELRAYVLSHPNLYDSVSEKLRRTPTTFTEEEKMYMNIIFGFNKRIHQELIGGIDSKDASCLFKSFRSATNAITSFEAKLQSSPSPRWYWLLHIAAGTFALNGIWQAARWLHLLN